nr:hypothetical protein [Ensifer sp. PDNC004]
MRAADGSGHRPTLQIDEGRQQELPERWRPVSATVVPVLIGKLRDRAGVVLVERERPDTTATAAVWAEAVFSAQAVYGHSGVLIGAVAFGSLQARDDGYGIPYRPSLRRKKIGRQTMILCLEVAVADAVLDDTSDDALKPSEMFAGDRSIDGEKQGFAARRCGRQHVQAQEVQAEAVLVEEVVDELVRRFDRSARVRRCNGNPFFQHSEDDGIKVVSGGQGVDGEHARDPEWWLFTSRCCTCPGSQGSRPSACHDPTAMERCRADCQYLAKRLADRVAVRNAAEAEGSSLTDA